VELRGGGEGFGVGWGDWDAGWRDVVEILILRLGFGGRHGGHRLCDSLDSHNEFAYLCTICSITL